MTTPEIAGLCERLRAALKGVTPGPWDDTRGRSGLRIIEGDSGCPVASYVSEKDAAFIALSREAAPVLLDTLERQAAEIARLRGALAEISKTAKTLRIATSALVLVGKSEAAEMVTSVADGFEAIARAALTGEDHD
jgi:hypothetical protein